ncbi:MAG TPA: hypothetical protein VJ302_32445 [Blastocatellia bacterium]|nr:hypothetical protein [Blastocatellia bacterium]
MTSVRSFQALKGATYFGIVCLAYLAISGWPLKMTRAGSVTSGVYGDPVQIGTITDSSLAEVSGLTPSRTAAGRWWVHNDSGDQARLYVIDSSGKRLGQYTVTGARNRDWEDLAGFVADKGRPMLYLADSGNNQRKRDDLTLYRIQEPDLSKGVRDGATEAAVAFPFRYPDGNFDAEALFVDPKNGRPYLVTKTFTPPCGVYRFPWPLRPNVKVTLEKVTGEAVDRISKLLLVTGAATAPDGNHVAVRTYFGAFELARAKGGAFETIFKSEPQSITLAPERQGEAISYARDGRSIVTTSEQVPAPIYKIDLHR